MTPVHFIAVDGLLFDNFVNTSLVYMKLTIISNQSKIEWIVYNHLDFGRPSKIK